MYLEEVPDYVCRHREGNWYCGRHQHLLITIGEHFLVVYFSLYVWT